MSGAPVRPGLTSRPSSMASLNKKIILVTGGNQGIGLEIVRSLSRQPEHQVLMGCRDTKKGEAAAASIGAPVNVNPIQVDITDDASVEHCVRTIEQVFGRLDVLVNNAGTAGNDIKKDGNNPTRREEWHHVINTNVTSTGVFTDAVIPLLQKSKAAKIIFISSAIGSIGQLQAGNTIHPVAPYYSSKSAVNMMTAWYAKAHPEWRVNAVDPGLRSTNFLTVELTDETDPAGGAVKAVQLVNEGPDGATGTFTNAEGPVPW